MRRWTRARASHIYGAAIQQPGPMASKKYIIVASHRRSGTHLTIDLIRKNFPQVNPDYVNLDRLLPGHIGYMQTDAFMRKLELHSGIVVLKTHASPKFEEFSARSDISQAFDRLLDNAYVVYVCRDGRDALVSLYYYMRSLFPVVRLQKFSDFLWSEDNFYRMTEWGRGLNRMSLWAQHVTGWSDRADEIAMVQFENLRKDPKPHLGNIANAVGLEPPKSIKRVQLPANGFWHDIWAQFRGRQRTDPTAIVPRLGRPGDWKRHFSSDDLLAFRDQAGYAMQRLGYSLED